MSRFLLVVAIVLVLPATPRNASAQQQLTPAAKPPTQQTPAPLAGAPPPVPATMGSTPGTTNGAATIPPAPTAAQAPMAAVPADWGLCQCISDKNALEFSCPGSVAACQSTCGTQYSYKPDARCRTAAATQQQ